jgi:C-terminal processing protease CtpA/Prc
MSFFGVDSISSAMQDWTAATAVNEGTRKRTSSTAAGSRMQLGISLGSPKHGGGASIASIKRGSPAWLAKLKPGDEIVCVAGVEVSSSSHSVKETQDLVLEKWASSEIESEDDIGRAVNFSESIPHEVESFHAGYLTELRIGVRDSS